MTVAALLLLVAELAGADAIEANVARRGTAAVTLAEVDARLEEVPANMRAGFMNSPDRIEQILSQLLLVEQIANQALAEGLEKDPAFAGQVELARKRILAKMKLDRVRAGATSNIDVPALAHERYLADSEKYYDPETRTARHILFGTDIHSDDEARASAEAALARARAGESFETLARELSEDEGTRNAGGLLADIELGRTDVAFENALFGLEKPGQISAVTKSQFGYHVIELVSIRPRTRKSFDSVRASIEAEVTAAEVERAARNYSDQLQSLAIDADAELVNSLRSRYGSGATTQDAKPRAD